MGRQTLEQMNTTQEGVIEVCAGSGCTFSPRERGLGVVLEDMFDWGLEG